MSHINDTHFKALQYTKRRNEYCPANERSYFSEINTHHHKVEIEGNTNQKHTGNEDLKRRFFIGERASSPSNSPSIPPRESNRNNGIFYQPHQPSYARARRICTPAHSHGRRRRWQRCSFLFLRIDKISTRFVRVFPIHSLIRRIGRIVQPGRVSKLQSISICKGRILHLPYSLNLIESTETLIYKQLSALVMYIYTAMSPRLKQTLRNRCWTACPFYAKLTTQSI